MAQAAVEAVLVARVFGTVPAVIPRLPQTVALARFGGLMVCGARAVAVGQAPPQECRQQSMTVRRMAVAEVVVRRLHPVERLTRAEAEAEAEPSPGMVVPA